MNGVRISPGSLMGVAYHESALATRHKASTPGYLLAAEQCQGFRFLRLTTLAVTPRHRKRAFSTQFRAQHAKGFFDAENTHLDQFTKLAHGAILRASAPPPSRITKDQGLTWATARIREKSSHTSRASKWVENDVYLASNHFRAPFHAKA
ncbi:MAG: hypothetical protein R3F37_04075 [Candidatus Competibacteraceae bacterium]